MQQKEGKIDSSKRLTDTQWCKCVLDIQWTIRGFGLLSRWPIREDMLNFLAYDYNLLELVCIICDPL